jgi:hypothetical protein
MLLFWFLSYTLKIVANIQVVQNLLIVIYIEQVWDINIRDDFMIVAVVLYVMR